MNVSFRVNIRKILLTYLKICSFFMKYSEIKIYKKEPMLEL